MQKFLVAVFAVLFSLNANASLIGFADVVLSYEENNDDVKGELGPGGFRDLTFTRAGDDTVTGEVADAVLGDDASSYLSLKIGQSVVLGFVNENIIDGVGNDIFVSEVGSASESADIFVSANGVDFTFLGTANNANGVSGFDLAAIGFTDLVSAIRIEGQSNGGSSPGFDLQFVEALNRVVVTPDPVNAPATLLFSLLGFGGIFLAKRR